MGLFRQPHSVTLKRPEFTKDAGTNVSKRSVPAEGRALKCMFQTREGTIIQDEGGNVITLVAIIYTKDLDVMEHDVIDVAIPGTTATFRCMKPEAKYGVNGKFSHYEISLVFDGA